MVGRAAEKFEDLAVQNVHFLTILATRHRHNVLRSNTCPRKRPEQRHHHHRSNLSQAPTPPTRPQMTVTLKPRQKATLEYATCQTRPARRASKCARTHKGRDSSRGGGGGWRWRRWRLRPGGRRRRRRGRWRRRGGRRRGWLLLPLLPPPPPPPPLLLLLSLPLPAAVVPQAAKRRRCPPKIVRR
jgi:hypothetical protein